MSLETFEQKTRMVVAVESSGAVRQLLSEMLKMQGFTVIQAVPTIQDAIAVMEIEDVGWVVSPLACDSDPNGFGLLKLCTFYPQLKDTRVTFLAEESEMDLLGVAFEHGLLSWIKKPFNKDTLSSELNELVEVLKNNEWNTVITAAHYLRKLLTEKQRYSERLDFERKLIKLYPNEGDLMVNLIEPFLKLEQTRDAKKVVKRIKTFWPEKAEKADKIFAGAYIPPEEGTEGSSDSEEPAEAMSSDDDLDNILDLNVCLIVDPSDEDGQKIEEALKESGAKEIIRFTDGEAAYNWMRNNEEPSIIVQEWRIPQITGPIFVQRVRNEGNFSVPIFVHTNIIDDSDEFLLKEMGVAKVLPKPLNKREFMRALLWAIQQERSPSETISYERKIRQALNDNKTSEAKTLLAKYEQDPNATHGNKLLMSAEVAYHEKKYAEARDLAVSSLKAEGDSIFILNLLGKILMQLGNFMASLQCFQKAQSLSPLNIERICAMADINNELGDKKESDSSLEEARDIDNNSNKILVTEAKIAATNGDSEKAKAIISQLDSLQTFVAYMNNKAVVFARCGRASEAIEIYQKAIASLPDGHADVRSTIQYNLGLAHVRQESVEEAIEALNKAIEVPNTKVYGKAKALHARLEKAHKLGKKITISPSSDAVTPNHKEAHGSSNSQSSEGKSDGELESTISATRGEICCYLLYQDNSDSEIAQALVANTPKFKPRKAIEREASMGFEKSMKVS